MNKLFVYGSLCPGRPNEHILQNIGGTFQKASVRGKLYAEGWGAAMGYPALLPDKAADKVEGYVFSAENLADHWDALDEFEGAAYVRELIQVELEDASYVEAYLYALNANR
ncbi:MAG: gamma-glutamylcyclotransferase family protein [Bacteroidota bacterium]